MVTNTPRTQAAGAGMSAASTARRDSSPVNNTTSANASIAANASGKPIAPLIHSKSASGSATMALAAASPALAVITRSAPENTPTAFDDVVLLRLEPDPKRQPYQPFAHHIGDGHAAAGAAVLHAGGRAVQRYIVEHRVDLLASQRLDEASARRGVGQDQVVGMGV